MLPPILEYLLEFIHDRPDPYSTYHAIDHMRRGYKSDEGWSLANEIEQAWTDVEGSDRAIVSRLAKGYQMSLIQVCPLLHTIIEI